MGSATAKRASRPLLEERQLPIRGRRAESAAIQLDALGFDARPLAGQTEPISEQLSPHSARLHPAEEPGVVVASAADRADDAHHLVAALGKVHRKPLAK